MTEGTGQFTVNGRTLAEVFLSPVTRFHAFEPLRMVASLEHYNVTALVSGGGLTGSLSAYDILFYSLHLTPAFITSFVLYHIVLESQFVAAKHLLR